MSSLNAMASIAVLASFAPLFAAAMPAAEPVITSPAKLIERANGAEVVGYYLNGTVWYTRTCNIGYFSSVGDIGGCCESSNCNFITTCAADNIFYQDGSSTDCGQACGTGTIYHTLGDSDPLFLYNCQGNWAVTLTTAIAAVATTTSPTTAATSSGSNTIVVSAGSAATSITSSSATSAASASSTSSPSSASSSIASSSSAGSSGSNNSASNSGQGSSSSHAGAIAGGVVGAVAAVAIAAVAIVYILKRNKSTKNAASGSGAPDDGQSPPMQQSAYTSGVPAGAGAGVYAHQQVYKPGQQQSFSPQSGYGSPNMSQGPYDQSQPIHHPGGHGPQELHGSQVQAPQELHSTNYGR